MGGSKRNDRIPESAYLKKPMNKVCDSVIDLINKEAGVDEDFKNGMSPLRFNKESNMDKYHISILKKENKNLDKDRDKLWKHNASLQKKIDDLEKQLKFKNLPLNERIEKEWIAKRENEEKLTNKKESE